ncbi:putative zinc-type alcohol dehydrogenase-like protein [Rhodothalassium salexigens DSM 2132]|uniref:alcohol dehydrogenase (NADP(+)) n=1 Tax=Rhodothalassium salexigens DSM 2132 TaxID=1188247 RepID=A0A4R2PEH7_RHOSA|nr:NAD(P)-dependent alcohol dehydrogenase [Rhodothalassium salexigens]MBB4211879.1 putative zinc-type alcohol dehydrogenase-like protein [Rhodothalassium salexigens DSM 2132]MBK1638920.1 alcohol dehydrogenase [Rhodothalassium salexigens DSM 2132]TCP33537.1 putative zinc-type alcohol dehydrogenase-like protein [Rhodothalassium salexigens DSM 2132]
MTAIRAYAAPSAGAPLEPFEYDPGPLGADQVEIRVESSGLCHSDVSMINDEWGLAQFPLVAGHEVVGTVVEAGANVTDVRVGQRVGLGWFSHACHHCDPCLSGDHNLCRSRGHTIVGRHGGFADRVRAQSTWVFPLPDGIDAISAGPLFCGGITVFNPLIQSGVKPTDRVGVVGIGGLGHLALQFLRAWGCEVTAFTSTGAKADEARRLGAHHVVDSRDPEALDAIAGTLDFLLVTVNVSLDWNRYLDTLAPRGTFHIVGAIPEPLDMEAFKVFFEQRRVTGSPVGSPHTTKLMLDFCARHGIKPQTEVFPMSRLNDAIAHLEAGKARYRVVLEADFA